MTDITDQDRCYAREWATVMEKHGAVSPPIRAAARVILATVGAPALSVELANITENWEEWATETITEALDSFTTRAAQMEKDIAEARAEVERLTAVNENLRRTDNYREFKQFLGVQKGAEGNAETLDPAYVKPGEAWIVECRGERRNAVKDRTDDVPWNTVAADGLFFSEENENVTLLHRLVPAPRVITNPDELDRLPFHAVIISTDRQADVYQKDSNGEWMDVTSYGNYSSREVIRIENAVTVLWEQEA